MIVSSRSFEEYTAFFGLDPTNLPASILDCSAGASSFTVEAYRRGVRAVAVDPAYRDRLAAGALVQAEQFSWEATAAQTLAVYGRAHSLMREEAGALT